MATTGILDATLEPGISTGRPVAMLQSLDLDKGDEVRLRVFKRGQRQPDHIAVYRVLYESPARYPARVRAAQLSTPEPIH